MGEYFLNVVFLIFYVTNYACSCTGKVPFVVFGILNCVFNDVRASDLRPGPVWNWKSAMSLVEDRNEHLAFSEPYFTYYEYLNI